MKSSFDSQHSGLRRAGMAGASASRHGVALVVTLILLAVITTLTIAFLALTHRETGAVDSMARTTDAELATDTALERAKAQILAGYAQRNQGLVNPQPTPPDYLGPDMFLSVCLHTNRVENLTNHLDGSVPVFVDTNRGGLAGPLDDRFFHDLNRNSYFEETGFVPVTDNAFGLVPDNNPGPFLTNFLRGDPQWIGVPQDPRRPHGPNNRYVGRYAFLVQPAGRSLDLNWIHNQSIEGRLGRDAYFRNQGFGPWELNLAAFLADLNTNEWHVGSPYFFSTNYSPAAIGGDGVAFSDAREFVDFRWNRNRNNLAWGVDLLPNAAAMFTADFIDGYADGPLLPLGAEVPNSEQNDNPSRPWPGSDSFRHLFSIHDLFDRQKLPGPLAPARGFRDRLLNASKTNSSYDRYTFYRMLAQLGTDSEPDELPPEQGGKINLNYINVGGWKASDMVPWTSNDPRISQQFRQTGPELFVNTVVGRLLREDGHTVTTPGNYDSPLNIVVTTNGYHPRIHQIVQIAANLLEATTGQKDSSIDSVYPYHPFVFQPVFERRGAVVVIKRYKQVETLTYAANVTAPIFNWHDLNNPANWPASLGDFDNFYDVPWIFGARKGLPNFNEFTAQSHVLVKRHLQFQKDPTTRIVNRTNQCFIIGVRNYHHTEFYNGYTNTYPRPLTVYVRNEMFVTLTNDARTQPVWTTNIISGYTNVFAANTWANSEDTSTSYRLSVDPGRDSFTNSIVAPDGSRIFPLNSTLVFTPSQNPATNSWFLTVSNRYRCYVFDSGRLVDSFASARMVMNLNISELLDKDVGNQNHRLYDPTPRGPFTQGVINQARINKGQTTINSLREWADEAGLEAQNFSTRYSSVSNLIDWFNSTTNGTPLLKESTFNPVRRVFQAGCWQANDPLVHYTVGDLMNPHEPTLRPHVAADRVTGNETNLLFDHKVMQQARASLGRKNLASKPWGDNGVFSFADHDANVRSPDSWDFPTNRFPGKFANVGWIGRVHRGTPWQTIYLKSPVPNYGLANWQRHVGGAFSTNTFPTRDWDLADIFTVAIHPNQTRGRLSINQTNAAAWSAVLAGINTSTLPDVPDALGDFYPVDRTVEPVASGALPNVNAPVRAITEGIAQVLAGKKQFRRLGDILEASALTYDSPYLNVPYMGPASTASKATIQSFLTDADYERIPQQILSLLKVGEPRFVVYAWGQSLKPARLGLERNGNTLSLNRPSIDPATKIVNNYQVTGESATRAVLRVVFPKKLAAPEVPLGHPYHGTPDYRKPRVVIESFNVIPVE